MSNELFWSHVDKSGDCWLWTAAIANTGYGVTTYERKYALAHRVSYILSRGPIPEGLQLDHLCRVRACVNPAHLEPVTIRENLMRGHTLAAENAAKTHCKRGHEFNEANTYVQSDGKNRGCRACMKEHQRKWSAIISERRRERRQAALS